jgi:hypothetical protein
MSVKSKSPFKKTSHVTPENYEFFAALLEVPVSALEKEIIGITDIYDNEDFTLVNFHFHPDLVKRLQEPQFGYTPLEIHDIQQVRGVVVDVGATRISGDPKNFIACKSSGMTSNCVRNSVELDGSFIFDTEFGECPQSCNSLHNIYKEWVYGSLLRIFCYNNVTFISTHKKISCANSFFASSRKFQDIFFQDQDVFRSIDDLFRSDQRNGLIHLFILSDPDLIPDSPGIFRDSRIYHISSYDLKNLHVDENSSMISRIRNARSTATKPISRSFSRRC